MSPTRSPVQRPGDRAWLFSRPFNVTSGKVDMRCLTFWYFISSWIYSLLTIYLITSSTNYIQVPNERTYYRSSWPQFRLVAYLHAQGRHVLWSASCWPDGRHMALAKPPRRWVEDGASSNSANCQLQSKLF